MKVRFTWNRAKAERNLRVHGISFEKAAEVFDDPNHVVGGNYLIEDIGERGLNCIVASKVLPVPEQLKFPSPIEVS